MSHTYRMRLHAKNSQHGAVLVVGLVMLTLMMLLAVSAFNASNVNLRIVTNTQARQEAIAAADQVIQQTISNNAFANTHNYTNTVNVDTDQDGTNDYTVQISANCLSFQAYPTKGEVLDPDDPCASSTSLGPLCQTVIWDISGTATPASSTAINAGTSVTIDQGITTHDETAKVSITCS